VAAPPPAGEPGRLARFGVGGIFLLPAVAILGVWILYPTVYTLIRSFFSGTLGEPNILVSYLVDAVSDYDSELLDELESKVRRVKETALRKPPAEER